MKNNMALGCWKDIKLGKNISVQVNVQDNSRTLERRRFSSAGIISKVHLISSQTAVDVDQNT